MYQRILRMIKEQFETNSVDSDNFFLNIDNVQNIINEANKDMALSPIRQKKGLRRENSISSIGAIIKQKDGRAFS